MVASFSFAFPLVSLSDVITDLSFEISDSSSSLSSNLSLFVLRLVIASKREFSSLTGSLLSFTMTLDKRSLLLESGNN
jgi:hypothetical protein